MDLKKFQFYAELKNSYLTLWQNYREKQEMAKKRR
jgi:hypothetical protein